MDEKLNSEFKRELSTAVGQLLSSLRQKANLSMEQVAEILAKARLEEIRRFETGEKSIHGTVLAELCGIYGADFGEVCHSIQTLVQGAKAKYPELKRPNRPLAPSNQVKEPPPPSNA